MHNTPPDTSHGYERSDAKLRPVGRWLIAAFALMFGAMAVSWWVVQGFSTMDDFNREPARLKNDRPLPPGLRLQANPKQEIDVVTAAEERTLTTYGWEDRSKGIIRLPISRAMELVAERGLPNFKAGRPASQGGQP